MQKFYTGVVRNRGLILALFILAAAVCLVLQRLVYVNYDVNDYLPLKNALLRGDKEVSMADNSACYSRSYIQYRR